MYEMKKLYLLLPILFLIYWGCEEPEEKDTTPPTVSISSHSSGQTVNEIITITVTTQDNEGISKVEFFIDSSLVFTDSESPYEYEWNTTTYNNGSYTVKVISYDPSDNSTESQSILLVVANSPVYPVSMLNDYSDINKKTSWYITNKKYNYFNIGYTSYVVFRIENDEIYPSDYCDECDKWDREIGGYIYSDLDDDGILELWQYYLKHPWPINVNGIQLYSNQVENIIETEPNPSDYSIVFGLTQVRKQVLSDLNNDGKQEIILFSSGLDKSPWPGDSLGIFYPSTQEYQYLTEDIGYFHGGAAGDINDDGFNDIVSYSAGTDVSPPHPMAYLNYGGGSFELNNSIFNSFYAMGIYTIELFDINGDNHLDLFLCGPSRLYAVLGNSSATFDFNNKINFSIEQNEEPMDIDFFDFNLDGKKDILILNTLNFYQGHSIKILISSENGYIDSTNNYIDDYTAEGDNFWIKWLFLKDIDLDGDIDIMADGLFGEASNHNHDIIYWENIGGHFYRRQIEGDVIF